MTTDGSSQPRRRYRFGEFEFDSRTGRLRRHDDGDEGANLSPQPACLLHLLLERDGDLVTRDELRAELWPEVHVDFDQSLNFCVHQVRTALGDSAGQPAYIETLPRRGYRLLQPVQAVTGRPSHSRRRNWLAAGLGVAVASTLALLAAVRFGGLEAQAVPTLAIMPFEAPEDRQVRGEPGRIAEALLLELGSLGASRLGVIGPATTVSYASDPTLERLIEETAVDWIINDRFIDSETSPTGSGLLIEIIRASDGVHVWVEAIDDASATDQIVPRVVAAVSDELEFD